MFKLPQIIRKRPFLTGQLCHGAISMSRTCTAEISQIRDLLFEQKGCHRAGNM